METLDITDVLVEKKLRFKFKDGGSYVRSKESKSIYPSSVSTYTADTNSVIRFNITGSPNQWLSLPSLLLGFTVENTAQALMLMLNYALYPLVLSFQECV